ncbi:hypothetical protein A0H76_1370 [Hepatospora eriocheir]|uniref:Uncharacterized protein n=1 Tax=Hepatospora eriocheir TaxID=1081669 RepID=A0A1X0QLM8_9MICR|nr:hypothetical protein HERIO_1841 [Hepatospora eriocheir]ORE00624.1 hypothetical protein A0H76_1370 [Hepatospora eriocheir]
MEFIKIKTEVRCKIIKTSYNSLIMKTESGHIAHLKHVNLKIDPNYQVGEYLDCIVTGYSDNGLIVSLK